MGDLPFNPNDVEMTNWQDPSPAAIVNLAQRVMMLELQVRQLQDAQPPVGG